MSILLGAAMAAPSRIDMGGFLLSRTSQISVTAKVARGT